jgi:hypothetical protein
MTHEGQREPPGADEGEAESDRNADFPVWEEVGARPLTGKNPLAYPTRNFPRSHAPGDLTEGFS